MATLNNINQLESQGEAIWEVCKIACEMAKKNGREQAIKFNDLVFHAQPDSNYSDICNIYSLMSQLRHLKYKHNITE